MPTPFWVQMPPILAKAPVQERSAHQAEAYSLSNALRAFGLKV